MILLDKLVFSIMTHLLLTKYNLMLAKDLKSVGNGIKYLTTL